MAGDEKSGEYKERALIAIKSYFDCAFECDREEVLLALARDDLAVTEELLIMADANAKARARSSFSMFFAGPVGIDALADDVRPSSRAAWSAAWNEAWKIEGAPLRSALYSARLDFMKDVLGWRCRRIQCVDVGEPKPDATACKACGKSAPLVDGECPDCRH